MTPYLARLRKKAGEQTSELLKIQTLDYVDFVSELINMANIMKKRFYVVIGWENIQLQNLSLIDKFLNRGNSISLLKISETEFKTRSDDLREKASVIASRLGSIGLHCKQLATKELIEIFYNFYNPGIADKERLSDLENLQANVVSRENRGGEFDIEKPHNTTDETPVIDNTESVREQDKAKKRAEAAAKATAAAQPQPAPKPKETSTKPEIRSTKQTGSNSNV